MKNNDKKQVIENLIIVPEKNKRAFWAKEIKCFNELYKTYQNSSFWLKVKFPYKLESINILRSGYYADELKNKYNRFFYKIPKQKKIELINKHESIKQINTYNKPRTLRDFLND